MNNNRRRNFRSRQSKNNFRRRNGSIGSNNISNNFNGNGNTNFNRNGSTNNIHVIEKAMQKYQQLAKDAQSNGDPILSQNYLQHADHYLRRFNELNEKRDNNFEKNKVSEKALSEKNDKGSENLKQSST